MRKKILRSNISSPEYEDNVYESQENFFEENTDSDIDDLNDLIGNLHRYCYELEKDASETSGSDSDTNEDVQLPTLPDSPGGSRNLVFSHESLTDLGLSRISPGFLKDNPENNFMQSYLSISLNFRMK